MRLVARFASTRGHRRGLDLMLQRAEQRYDGGTIISIGRCSARLWPHTTNGTVIGSSRKRLTPPV